MTAVEWLAEKYNYVTWMRNRDEISAGLADEWRKDYLEQAKRMEKEQVELRYKDGRPMRKYNSPKLEAIENEISDDLLTEEEIAEFKRELKEVMKKPKTEISDEEIEKAIIDQDIVKQEGYCHCFLEGAKWYREKLKKKNE